MLEDARYEPPRASSILCRTGRSGKSFRRILRLPPGTLSYRWARATILMVSLQQMGAGAVHPLSKRRHSIRFEEDFKVILMTYRVLKQDIQARRRRANQQ